MTGRSSWTLEESKCQTFVKWDLGNYRVVIVTWEVNGATSSWNPFPNTRKTRRWLDSMDIWSGKHVWSHAVQQTGAKSCLWGIITSCISTHWGRHHLEGSSAEKDLGSQRKVLANNKLIVNQQSTLATKKDKSLQNCIRKVLSGGWGRWLLPSVQHWWGHTWMLRPVLGTPVQDRCGLTGVSPVKDQKGD